MTEIIVTDHAVERYRQRVASCDDETARTDLAEMAAKAVARGCVYYEIDGFVLALKGNVVKTIYVQGAK